MFLLAILLAFPPPDTVKIVFVGDVMLARRVGTHCDTAGVESVWKYVAPILKNDGIAVINLESIISTKGKPIPKPPNYIFRADTSNLSGLSYAGIDVVCLANNHAWDFHAEGLRDCILLLRKSDFSVCGAGLNAREFFEPTTIWRRGMWVSIFGLNDTPSSYAGKDSPGVPPVWTDWGLDEALSIIGQMRDAGTPPIVFIHWGEEYHAIPTRRQRELARKLVSAGASAIVGSHPHRVQGIEIIDGVPVAYSLGNFIFDQRDSLGNWGAILELSFCGGVVTRVRAIATQTLTKFATPIPVSSTDGKLLFMKLCEQFNVDVVESDSLWLEFLPEN